MISSCKGDALQRFLCVLICEAVRLLIEALSISADKAVAYCAVGIPAEHVAVCCKPLEPGPGR